MIIQVLFTRMFEQLLFRFTSDSHVNSYTGKSRRLGGENQLWLKPGQQLSQSAQPASITLSYFRMTFRMLPSPSERTLEVIHSEIIIATISGADSRITSFHPCPTSRLPTLLRRGQDADGAAS